MADLVTLDEFKAYKGLKSTENDAVHEILIDSVSAFIKSYCGYSFVDYVTDAKTEYFDMWDTVLSTIFPTEFPIISVTSLWERSSQSESYTQLYTGDAVNGYDYVIQTDIDAIYRTTDSGLKAFPYGPASVKLIYKAGYANLPDDLKLAVYDLVSYYQRGDHAVNRSVNASNLQLPTPDFNLLPKHIRRVLDLYRNL